MPARATPIQPPAPRPSLRVGIIGHRPNKLLPNHLPALEAQLRSVLFSLSRSLSSVAATYSFGFAQDAPPTLRIISSLAAGTDILAARNTTEVPHARLNAVLPFAREDFQTDLAGESKANPEHDFRWEAEYERVLAAATSVFELETPDNLDHPGARARSYEAAGQVINASADILVAVWDGEESSGRGGTAEFIADAQDRGMPVVHVTPDGASSWLLDNTTFRKSGGESDESEPVTDTALFSTIEDLIAPPLAGDESLASGDHTNTLRLDYNLELYLSESWPTHTWMSVYRFLLSTLGGQRWRGPRLDLPGWEQRNQSEWAEYLEKLDADRSATESSAAGNEEPPLSSYVEPIRQRWIWADQLANLWSDYYRSAYLLNFLLAGIAVLLGLSSLLWSGDPEGVYGFKAATVFVEVILVVAILALTTAGRRGGWHSRWVNYRRLAEELRAARTIPLLGRSTHAIGTKQAEPRKDARWILWYVRATLNDIDLPSIRVSRPYLQSIIDATLAGDVGKPATEEGEATGQIGYHHRNAHMLETIDHRLHIGGQALFMLTGLIAFGYFLVFLVEWWLFPEAHAAGGAAESNYGVVGEIKPWVTFLAGALPALAASVAGIKAQADFPAFADQSKRTEAALMELHDRLQAIYAHPTRRDLMRYHDAASSASLSDVRTWSLIYSNRELTLPA